MRVVAFDIAMLVWIVLLRKALPQAEPERTLIKRGCCDAPTARIACQHAGDHRGVETHCGVKMEMTPKLRTLDVSSILRKIRAYFA